MNAELSSVARRIASAARLTHVQDNNATIAKVAEELEQNAFVHLACHGPPDRKLPLKSGFAAGRGLLKIESIMRSNSQDAQFAYWSACHTAVGDEESPDEMHPSCYGLAVRWISFDGDWDKLSCG